ncbi:MAG: ABC transporter ATP-binding protein [Deltaproteobacteria bacterium]|nr:ABC transporter ATP-binding protein [Deltaproteobacteria bacterium]
MAAVVLEARGLGRRYGAFAALEGLELQLHAGEVFGLLGPNGAGKSTTLNLFMGFLRPSSGSATILGHDCTREAHEVARVTGHLPEELTLFENLTGRETLSFVLAMRGDTSPARWSAVEASIERLGLGRDLDQLVAGYSMGTRKKLALVLALAHDPQVLLLDEPTNGLDPVVAREVRELLQTRAREGALVVLSTHLLEVAERLCHRLGVLVQGRLRALGTPEEVLRQTGRATLEEAFLALSGTPP